MDLSLAASRGKVCGDEIVDVFWDLFRCVGDDLRSVGVAASTVRVAARGVLFEEVDSVVPSGTPSAESSDDERAPKSASFCALLGQAPRKQADFHSRVPVVLGLCAVADALLLWSLLKAVPIILGGHHAVSLGIWAAGGLFLSFPASWIIHEVKKRWGMRFAFLVEVGTFTVSFVWLSWGTALMCYHFEGLHAAPSLWWACLASETISWTCIDLLVLTNVAVTVWALFGGCLMDSSRDGASATH